MGKVIFLNLLLLKSLDPQDIYLPLKEEKHHN